MLLTGLNHQNKYRNPYINSVPSRLLARAHTEACRHKNVTDCITSSPLTGVSYPCTITEPGIEPSLAIKQINQLAEGMSTLQLTFNFATLTLQETNIIRPIRLNRTFEIGGQMTEPSRLNRPV